MPGACVSRARLQAADGMPMPTKQMSLLRSARAAAIVIISVALKAIWSSFSRAIVRRLRNLACGTPHPSGMHREGLRPLVEHVRLYPGEERVAVARDRVPGLIIGVVALVVAVRIGGMRAARHADDGLDGPARQDHRIGAALAEIRNDLLDRHERAFRGQHHLLLYADDAFDQHVAGGVRLERVD